jgi:hypothetical protein
MFKLGLMSLWTLSKNMFQNESISIVTEGVGGTYSVWSVRKSDRLSLSNGTTRIGVSHPFT